MIELQLLLATFAAWSNRHEAGVMASLVEENRALKEQLESGGTRLRFTDGQRRHLPAKGRPLGRKALSQNATFVTPETILAWRRRLIAAKWTYPIETNGMPWRDARNSPTHCPMAKENSSWGCPRIQGALRHVGHHVARGTIAKVLKEHGIGPSPQRPMSWRTFIRAHAHLIAAADFSITEVWTVRGLVRHLTLFFLDLATRRVHVAGTSTNPTSAWMEQIARNVTDREVGFLRGKRYLVVDRDSVFAPKFKSTAERTSVEVLVTAYQAPNMNAHAERFVRSIRTECLDQMIFVGRASLERSIAEHVAHYHGERSHHGSRERDPGPAAAAAGGFHSGVRAARRAPQVLSSSGGLSPGSGFRTLRGTSAPEPDRQTSDAIGRLTGPLDQSPHGRHQPGGGVPRTMNASRLAASVSKSD